MQALMLAAGMGRRLGKYTEKCPKCMIQVGGKTLLERTVEALRLAGIKKLIMVVGWESNNLIRYIQENFTDISFEFIFNHDYANTNNIYSLYLARECLKQDNTLLLESDVVFDIGLLREIVQNPAENLAVVAKYEQWMDGTVVTVNSDKSIAEFIEKKDFLFQNADNYYKTVNIYKFSPSFSKNKYIPFLEAYITAYGKNQYYEAVLRTIAYLPQAQLKAYILQDSPWYEIDNAHDLHVANTIFAAKSEKLHVYEAHYGGYWQFPGIRDFCYLVNPYFPPAKMHDQMKYFFAPLLTQYPSGMDSQKLVAGKMFQIDEDYLLVGNGAAELINALGQILSGNFTVPSPSFNEYIRCFNNCNLVTIPTKDTAFQLDKRVLVSVVEKTDILVLVNPDNPSGSFLAFEDLSEILDYCKSCNTLCIVDESFVDFAERGLRYTLLRNDLLERWPNLIVIKSISKSYGVPGLRLGILATTNRDLLTQIRNILPIWNINSFAEYFLQLCPFYMDDYWISCDKLARQRRELFSQLASIRFLKPLSSQANYIMCEVKGMSARELSTELMDKANLLIKDLSQKDGICGEFIRIAVKDETENNILICTLRSIESSVLA